MGKLPSICVFSYGVIPFNPLQAILRNVGRLKARGNARQKLARKGCHAIIVNDVSDPAIGFDSDENAATLVTKGGEVVFPRTSKQALAAQLVDAIAAIHQREGANPRKEEPLPRLA